MIREIINKLKGTDESVNVSPDLSLAIEEAVKAAVKAIKQEATNAIDNHKG